MKPVLLLDSSILGVSLGIADLDAPDSQILLWTESRLVRGGSAALLTEMYTSGMQKLSLLPGSIEGICLSSGPGSFTGLKVGFAWAAGFAAGGSVKFAAPSSLQLIAASRGVGHLIAVLGATKTHGFSCILDGQASSLKVFDRFSEAFKDLCERTKRGAKVLLLGNWQELCDQMAEAGVPFEVLPEAEVASLALTGLAGHAASIGFDQMSWTLGQPNYLRKSTAEERMEKIGQ